MQEAYDLPMVTGFLEDRCEIKLCRQQGCTAATELMDAMVFGDYFNSWHKAGLSRHGVPGPVLPIPPSLELHSLRLSSDLDSDLLRVLAHGPPALRRMLHSRTDS